VTKKYGSQLALNDVSFSVSPGQVLGFLGPNGAGKSTLLHLIMGMEQPTEGTIKLGDHNVIPGYFEQNQAEALELSKTVLDTIHDEVPKWTNEEVRSLLGRFLFSGETVAKLVTSLSGGEKARLALAKMLLQPANLLILDEPTNHLDIPAKEMLEEAIRHYDGTVVVISHDRYFISQIANKIVEIRNGELRLYRGDYHYYLDKLAEEKAETQSKAVAAEKVAKTAAKRAKQKEKEIARKTKQPSKK
ncbi:MAG: ATP-binding cassette domain-containing protein, partial [Synechococcales cyanobacterium]